MVAFLRSVPWRFWLYAFAALLLYGWLVLRWDSSARSTSLPEQPAQQVQPQDAPALSDPPPGPATVVPTREVPTSILPIASLTRDSRPPMWSELLRTGAMVDDVTRALARSDVAAAEHSLAALALQAAHHPKPRLNRADAGEALLDFTAEAYRTDEAHTLLWLTRLRLRLVSHPYDAEPTCEWAWLALSLGEREFAEDAFLRAIWAEPEHSCGWYGLGVVAESDAVRYGAFTRVETLRAEGDPYLHEMPFTREALARAAIDSARFRILFARGQRNSLELRGEPVPDYIEMVAAQPLPAPPVPLTP